MSASNIRSNVLGNRTYNGAPAARVSIEKTLVRMSLASLLWEDQFYIDGKSNAEIVKNLVAQADPKFVQDLAVKARSEFKLRHVPLMLLRELARKGQLPADVLAEVIQRPDEMGEFLSIYWKDGKTPIANQVKKGLAKAFVKFNEYSLAKFDKNSAAISVRDVMFLTHVKPTTPEQEALFKRIASNEMVVPMTWETELSAGADKAETFSRLMAKKKLGALAFLRNLRNMVNSGVPESTIRAYSSSLDVSKVLPFRYLAAARIVPQFEDMLEAMMFKSLAGAEKMPGKTVLLVDISGSMFGAKVSAKSDLDRFDAACALAVLCREVCEDVEIYTFASNGPVRVAPRRGFALIEAIRKSQPQGGTNIGKAVRSVNENTKYDRLIVMTDEQSSDVVPSPKGRGYMINVASYEHGVSSGKGWENITGFSEAIVSYIQALEKV